MYLVLIIRNQPKSGLNQFPFGQIAHNNYVDWDPHILKFRSNLKIWCVLKEIVSPNNPCQRHFGKNWKYKPTGKFFKPITITKW